MAWRVVAVCVFAAVSAFAQEEKKAAKKEPRVFVAIPLGAKVGATTKVTLRGANLDTASEIRIVTGKGAAKIIGKGKAPVPDKNPDKVGETQVEIELTLEAGLPGDSISLSAVTPAGQSVPHAILLDQSPVLAEKEPNDGFPSAQVITLPAVISATIQRPKDVDLFRFEGKKGQKLHAEILASWHGAPVDAILTLYDAKSQQIAVNDDFAKEHRDAKLEATLPADGVYYLSVMDAHDSGSNLHVYRLLVK